MSVLLDRELPDGARQTRAAHHLTPERSAESAVGVNGSSPLTEAFSKCTLDNEWLFSKQQGRVVTRNLILPLQTRLGLQRFFVANSRKD